MEKKNKLWNSQMLKQTFDGGTINFWNSLITLGKQLIQSDLHILFKTFNWNVFMRDEKEAVDCILQIGYP